MGEQHTRLELFLEDRYAKTLVLPRSMVYC